MELRRNYKNKDDNNPRNPQKIEKRERIAYENYYSQERKQIKTSIRIYNAYKGK